MTLPRAATSPIASCTKKSASSPTPCAAACGATSESSPAVAASPAVYWLLRLDGLLPAVLLGLCVVPVTVMGGQAGVLQGERRWLPLSLLYLSVGVPRVLLGGGCLLVSATEKKPDTSSNTASAV